MKLRFLVVAAAFATSLQPITTPAQVITNTRPIAATNLASAALDLLHRPYHGAKMTLIAAEGDGELAAITKPLPSLPTPGVYKTAPFTCIVVVPGKHADDRSVVKPTEVDSAMPVVKPELRFIPLHSK
jgi:hypothetical protein